MQSSYWRHRFTLKGSFSLHPIMLERLNIFLGSKERITRLEMHFQPAWFQIFREFLVCSIRGVCSSQFISGGQLFPRPPLKACTLHWHKNITGRWTMTLLPLASRNWAVPILQLKNYFLLLSQVSLKNHKTPLAVSEVFIYLFKTVQFNFCKELNCGAPLYTLYHIFLSTVLKMWVILNLLWMLLKMDLQMSTSTTISLAVETAWGSDTNTYLRRTF